MDKKKCSSCDKLMKLDNFTCKNGVYVAKCKECSEKYNINARNGCPCGNKGTYGFDNNYYCSECLEDADDKEEYKRVRVDGKCEVYECKTKASYGYKKGERLRCKIHKINNMVDVSSQRCEICEKEGVIKRAHYKLPNDKTYTRCKKHKSVGMEKYNSKFCIICKEEGINKRATFGNKGEKAEFCKEHSKKGMINVIAKNCIDCAKEGIFTQPCYGLTKGNPEYCKSHSTKGMKRCVGKNCPLCEEKCIIKQPSFGRVRGQPLFCGEHKEKGMIDCISRNCIVCETLGEFTQPTYGREIGKSSYCKKHRDEDMVDCSNKGCITCADGGIFTNPTYGINKPEYCKKHKTKEMKDLKHKSCDICIERGKFTRPSYGFEKNKPTRCITHKDEGMFNCIHKICEICESQGKSGRAYFGLYFESVRHCRQHALPNEVKITNPKCQECKGKNPFYSNDYTPRRCENCKYSTDSNIIEKECVDCKLKYFIPEGEEKCADCKGYKQVRKVKEDEINNLLLEYFPDQFTNDVSVSEGCSKLRPDFLFNTDFALPRVVVEVNERQHKRYICSIEAEMKRAISIQETDFGGAPTIFVMYNPDTYSSNGREKIVATKTRHRCLIDTLYSLTNLTVLPANICCIYLYYDDFNSVEVKPLTYEVIDKKLKIKHKHPLSIKEEHWTEFLPPEQIRKDKLQLIFLDEYYDKDKAFETLRKRWIKLDNEGDVFELAKLWKRVLRDFNELKVKLPLTGGCENKKERLRQVYELAEMIEE